MSYGDLIQDIREDGTLFSVLFELTYDCNWDCVFCYNDTNLQGRKLSTKDIIGTLASLSKTSCLYVTLSGGEPMVHPDFFEIAEAAKSFGFVVRIKTNGARLSGPELERLVTKVRPQLIEVSLHGADAKTHDRQTRTPGSFDELWQNLAAAKARGLRIRINSTLTKWNESQVSDMFDLCDDAGFPLRFDPDVTMRDDGDTAPLTLGASPEGLRSLFQVERERTRQSQPPDDSDVVMLKGARKRPGREKKRYCGAATMSLIVDPFGTVYPCVQYRVPLGNLHDASIVEIFEGQAAVAARNVNEQAMDTVRAEGGLPGFCPGTAHQLSGDATKPYASAQSRKAILAEVYSAPATQPVGKASLGKSLPVL